MQSIGKKIALVVLLSAAFVLMWKYNAPKPKDVSLAQTSWQAAQELVDSCTDGTAVRLFHSQDIDEKKVFHLVQAIHPYASTLSSAAYKNGNLQLTYEVRSEAEQDEGLALAREQGAQAAQGEETITGRLGAIHDALLRSCVYAETASEDAPRLHMAAGVSQDGTAVCAGYARAFQAMCDGAGLDVYYVENDDMTHAWNVVRLYGETYFIDCTYDDPVPDLGDRVCRDNFMVSPAQVQDTHQWDEALYTEMLDELYPADFAYIQRMQDLRLADAALRAADTDEPATQQELDALNDVLGTCLADSVTPEEDTDEAPLTRGALYRMGYEALWEQVDGERRIEKLIDARIVPPMPARQMGF